MLFTRKYHKVSKIEKINEWKYSNVLGRNYTIRAIFCYIQKEFLILNKGSDVIASIHDTTNKVLSSSSNYIVDVVMWPNFG